MSAADATVGAAAPPPSPLANREFRKLMLYRISTMLSYQIVAVAVGWHVYQLTKNPFALGLIGLAEILPFFCVAPFAGYLVDHLPRRKLGITACLGLLTTAVVLASVTLLGIVEDRVWPIYAAIMLTGCARAFLGPVYNALFARVLKREQFARGASFGAVVFQSGLVIGPFVGGVLVKFGMHLAYGVAAAIALVAAAALAWLQVTEPAPVLQREPVFQSIREGLRFVFSHQVVVGALALDMFAVLFGGAIALSPAFIHDVLELGPEALGVLRGAPALGAVVVGLWLARHPLQANAGRVLLCAVVGFGLCILGFGLSRTLWMAAFFLLLSGICDGVSVVLRSTILQLATPDDMRGRVSSINGLFVGSSNELGAFYAGSMARLLGLVPAIVLGGFVTMGVAGVTAWKAPKLRRLDLRELQ